jgi:stringent starvation protein B
MDDANEARGSVERLVRDLMGRGSSAHLLVDATREGVDVPDSVRDQWKQKLVLDLNPSWPMNIVYDEQGMELDLSFGGLLSRCRIPFHAVWAVVNPSGKGHVFHANVPPALADEIERDSRDARKERLAQKTPRPTALPAQQTAKTQERSGPPRLKLVKGGKS